MSPYINRFAVYKPISARRGRRNVQTNYRCTREDGYVSTFHRTRHVKPTFPPSVYVLSPLPQDFIVIIKTIGTSESDSD